MQRWAGLEGDFLQAEETRSEWLQYPPGTLLHEIYTGWRWPRVTGKIEHRPLDYAKIWRMAQAKTRKPVKFGTCCSQVMSLFLDIHTPHYKDKREVIWDLAVAMNKELLALRDAGCKCIQVEEPCFHFMANTFGKDHEQTQVHDRRLQPRGRGAGRRGDLDSHLLGQPQHAAGPRRHQLRRLDRALPGTLPRRRLDGGDEGPQLPRHRAVRAASSTT